MQVLHDRFANDDGFSLVAVHVDDGTDPTEHLQKGKFTYRVVPNGQAVAAKYGVSRIPEFVVIDADGRVIHRQVGALNAASRDALERLARDAAH